MLQHSLPLDLEAVCTWSPAPHRPDAAPLPRVNLTRATAALIAYDLACALVFLAALKIGHAAPAMPAAGAFGLAAAVTILTGAVCLRMTRLYSRQTLMKGRSLSALSILASSVAFLPVLIAAIASAAIRHDSLTAPVLTASAAVVSVAAGHVVWRVWLDHLLRQGWCLDRVIVLAQTTSEARIFAASLEQRSAGRLRATSSLALSDASRPDCFAWIERSVRNGDIDQVVIAEGRDMRGADRSMIFQLVRGGADVTLVPVLAPAYRVGKAPSLSPDVPPMHEPAKPLNSPQAAMKRALDIASAGLALLLSLPVLLLIAAAIRLDSRGPVFFRQTRTGADGQPFMIWKFRTMHVGPPDLQKVLQTRRGDPRVTRVGRFLRRTSLDELPQLLNVLTGDMSVVGPRPHAVGMLVAGALPEELLPDYVMRHRMKPGITGWAQVNGSRGEIESARALRRRFALDRHYIENWSLRMDIRILMRTLALPFLDRHAF